MMDAASESAQVIGSALSGKFGILVENFQLIGAVLYSSGCGSLRYFCDVVIQRAIVNTYRSRSYPALRCACKSLQTSERLVQPEPKPVAHPVFISLSVFLMMRKCFLFLPIPLTPSVTAQRSLNRVRKRLGTKMELGVIFSR